MSNVFAIMTLKGRRKQEMKNTEREKGNKRNRSEVVKREKNITELEKGTKNKTDESIGKSGGE